MTKFGALVLIVALRIIYHPSHAQNEIDSFANPVPSKSPDGPGKAAAFRIPNPALAKAKFISFEGSIANNKVILNWTIGENETADQFEVEKSSDGKNFYMAALVFGTDKPAVDKYQFYEKAVNQKVLYRIKLINKNRQTAYSAVVEINPTV